MSLASALLDLLLEAFNNVEVAKNVALASTTFFVYDMLITLGPEVRYVWSAKWGYGRVAFHFNRIWSILVLGIYLPMIFGYDVPIPRLVFTFGSNDLYSSFDTRCRQVILFYGYGVVLLIFNTSIVMSLRAWILYDRNPFVAAGLALCCLGGATACIAILHLDTARATYIPNIMPDLITGCLTILPKRITLVPYLIGLSLDTAIFLATWYRTWKLNRNGIRIPLISCLMRDGLFYYVFNCASLLISIGLGMNSKINNVAVGSGYIIAIHSTLCSRILLSLRVFNAESNVFTGSSGKTGSSTLHDAHWGVPRDRSYYGLRKNTSDRDSEMQGPPVELKELSRI
ncbi:unnamed protein product [Rhizoctonia solani]|uniref:DUF6533 domain-containing protein n=1 Tax=Rhizoctonia solani TaxID=456999 RepID=A0A8H3DIR0_9AGAM|nr:unnamed protein product [Rhizoctonia solani]CAE6529229.1 unnamed protein product [Rhizoctonia solani]